MKIAQITGCPGSRRGYIACCKYAVREFAEKCKKIEHQYVYKHDRYYEQEVLLDDGSIDLVWKHKKLGPRVGVIVSYLTPEGKLFMGASLCDLRCDEFDRHIGLYKALLHAKPVIGVEISAIFEGIPQSLQRTFAHVFDRFHQLADC